MGVDELPGYRKVNRFLQLIARAFRFCMEDMVRTKAFQMFIICVFGFDYDLPLKE